MKFTERSPLPFVASRPLQGRVRQEGTEAAQRDFGRVALFAVRRRAGDRLDRLTHRDRRDVADIVRRQRVDDRGFRALGIDRILDRLADAGDDDRVFLGSACGAGASCAIAGVAAISSVEPAPASNAARSAARADPITRIHVVSP